MILDAKLSPRQLARRRRLLARERFKRARLAERAYARRLSAVAKQVGELIKGMTPKNAPVPVTQIKMALSRYADMLRPWAESVARSLISEVGQRDERAWAELGREVGRSLRSEIRNAPTGQAMQKIMNEQVDLIQSLPRKAAERVHYVVIKGISEGQRADVVAEEVLKTGKVTKSRAMLIARTETTRAASALVEARARFIGSEGYIWRTAGDADVRDEHKKLEGKYIPYDRPPVAGTNGMRYHAGAGPNCRCWQEPVVPDRLH